MYPNPRTLHSPAPVACSAALAVKAPRLRARWQHAARKQIAPRGGSFFG
jgi:hypothetical protein